ncbi:MAG: hypothetical protein PWR04_1154 [Anaerophaga sp.]|nr:hypothetical protein [Anaerophaga sp.]
MKQIHFLMLSVMALFVSLSFSSCEEDEEVGQPKVDYVRVTDPASSDSMLVGAYQGNVVAIMGENLGSAVEVWFNDRQTPNLNPAYVTNESIIVTVPTKVPSEITNQMKIVFADGSSLLYDFEVHINKPEISRMACEYVPESGEAVIYGNYFYEPVTVTFSGGVSVEPDVVEDEVIHVTVPEGAQPGPVTVSTNFGKTESDFWFRDNRNIVISSDPFTGWWNESFVVTDPGEGDPPAINGNYIRVNQSISSWGWVEVVGGPASAMGDISKNIPDEAILNPGLYNFKFEINTMKPYDNNMIKLNFGLQVENNDAYKWAPPYDTEGQWETVVIPFDEMVAAYEETGSNISVNPDGYWTRVLFHGEGDLDCDISFDNFRIVPKTLP